MIFNRHKVVLLLTFIWLPLALAGQEKPVDIGALVQSFKKDPRGPYQAIRWFCPDGRVLPPDQRCNQPGAIQHALHKDVVQKIAREQGIYLGQILAGTPFDQFLDESRHFSRAKQYQLEKYLQAIDDGWILRRARFYRGAIQVEDESDWGERFLTHLAGDDRFIITQFFLLRQWARDLPHQMNDDRWQNIRAVSRVIGDSLPAFTDLRVKLHGQPEFRDIQQVRNFYQRNQHQLNADMKKRFEELIRDLETVYQPFNRQSIRRYVQKLPPDSPILEQAHRIMETYGVSESGRSPAPLKQIADYAELLWRIRRHLPDIAAPDVRLSMLNLSVEMERQLFRLSNEWSPANLGELLRKSDVLTRAAAACGYLEIWEWEAVAPHFHLPAPANALSLEAFLERADLARRVVEWGTGMIRAHYQPVVDLFGEFEPLAYGFIDDRIRSSILLPLGNTAAVLREQSARLTGLNNRVLNFANPGHFQGLNPGFALGELVVVPGSPEHVEFSSKKIYAIQRPPADLKPVAGIMTVAEGNLVSHVQLLARNLGIPNAVLSHQDLRDLLPYSGATVFFAVSPGGAVVLKLAEEMTVAEKALFDNRQRPEERVAVPLDRLDLNYQQLLSLRKLRAKDSGKYCGPKAANLGELKHLFPDRVVEGFAIPFGIFRNHMDQPMPGQPLSYWEFLRFTFDKAATDRRIGVDEATVEANVLQRLALLREAIRKMPFRPGFREKIERGFVEILGSKIGQVPVFIRSDTNMEDLKDFTGAGLNLTVFNVADEERIFQAIRDVWASPYTERSYRWRQKYLLNPENVYPSILILPTVDVEKSGVLITTGLSSNDPRDVTVAFSRGAGGAVEGQAAESYLLRHDGSNYLLSPAREATYTTLPPTGGTRKAFTDFHQPLLSPVELAALRTVARQIRQKVPVAGALDVELGFQGGQIWLFQVRPFVENKRARSSEYLRQLDPPMPGGTRVGLDTALESTQ